MSVELRSDPDVQSVYGPGEFEAFDASFRCFRNILILIYHFLDAHKLCIKVNVGYGNSK